MSNQIGSSQEIMADGAKLSLSYTGTLLLFMLLPIVIFISGYTLSSYLEGDSSTKIFITFTVIAILITVMCILGMLKKVFTDSIKLGLKNNTLPAAEEGDFSLMTFQETIEFGAKNLIPQMFIYISAIFVYLIGKYLSEVFESRECIQDYCITTPTPESLLVSLIFNVIAIVIIFSSVFSMIATSISQAIKDALSSTGTLAYHQPVVTPRRVGHSSIGDYYESDDDY